MENIDEEKLLTLSLATVTNSSYGGDPEIKKRKRIIINKRDALFLSRPLQYSYHHEGREGKIFRLLQTREQMLKVVEHKRRRPTLVLLEEGSKGLELIHLLLITAKAVNENNLDSALENLNELYQNVSLNGDSVQRVVAYFADGLAAKLLTRKSPFFDMIIKEPTNTEEFLAFIDIYRASPYYQFAHFTANQAIMEAFEKEERYNNRALHVIDFDISYGFQWPSLIQSLSEKATIDNRISLRITGYGRSWDELRETANRLMSFSKGFKNIMFEFQGLLRGCKIINLRKRKNETIAVNLVFHLNTLHDVFKVSDTLKLIHSLSPSIVTLVEQEGARSTISPRKFLSRFMESLHYFAAMFDSLDDCLPPESTERLSIEKNHLGKEIKAMHNYDDDVDDDDEDDIDYCSKYESIETWKMRMENHGFEGIGISSKSMIQARLLLKIRTQYYCPLQFDGQNSGGFKVFERDDGKAISLGWQHRSLLTASAWHCV